MARKIPPVTIGLPVYNGQDYLAESLDSLIGQTFGDFELIVSDNGSSDRTAEICRAYAERDNRILYLRNEENRGGAWNFNHVFRLSRSPFFKFAAHDDVCEPVFLERCYARLRVAPSSVVLCHPKAVRLDAEGREVGVFEERLDLRQPRPHQRLGAYLRSFMYANPLFGLMRAPAMETTGLLGRYDSADMVLLAELAIRGEFWELDEPLFKRRMHEKSSREANPTPAEVTRWFDPTIERQRTFRRQRMFVELHEAVWRAELPPAERARCFREVVGAWVSRYGKMMVWELWSATKSSARRRGADQGRSRC